MRKIAASSTPKIEPGKREIKKAIATGKNQE